MLEMLVMIKRALLAFLLLDGLRLFAKGVNIDRTRWCMMALYIFLVVVVNELKKL